MTNIVELTKKLISIPSWVDAQTNEIEIGNFIINFLRNNSILSIIKEEVIDGRFNIYASNSDTVDTLIMGHIDTVGVNGSWESDPTTPTIKGEKLFGRGSTDMKSGLAAMLLAAADNNLKPNSAFLFYIDEEYNFAGIKQFMVDFGSKIKPKSIISLDGSELEIANGCRGLIEISTTIKGKSCHAATPQNGVNAIEVATKSVEKLKRYLSKYVDQELGCTSVNLASISGGRAANVVPDNCQIVLDIRPGSSELNAGLIVKQLGQYIKKLGGELAEFEIKFDFGSWLTPQAKLKKLGIRFKNISTSGYIDTQMLWQLFDKPVCLTIGAGEQGTAHTSNEFVKVSKLNRLPQTLKDIINNV